MAEATVNRGLTVKPYGCGMRAASRKTQWMVSSDAPKNVDALTFTSRDNSGRICWWDVAPPKTEYWHVHEMLGRAYAFELLDLLNNPEAEGENEQVFAAVSMAIAQWLPSVSHSAASGMADGFFRVMSEFMATGQAVR